MSLIRKTRKCECVDIDIPPPQNILRKSSPPSPEANFNWIIDDATTLARYPLRTSQVDNRSYNGELQASSQYPVMSTDKRRNPLRWAIVRKICIKCGSRAPVGGWSDRRKPGKAVPNPGRSSKERAEAERKEREEAMGS